MRDYIGFTFGQYHSSELGLYRVSDGNRFRREVSGGTQDTVLRIEGSDVSYFVEARLEPRTISLNIAYDSLSEEQVSLIGKVFDGRTVHPLILDELPFKAYYARVHRAIELSYIPFGTMYGERIYKGEGSIEFMLYDPLAVSTGKYLADYPTRYFPNRDEWAVASRMKMDKGDYDGTGENILMYNAGDISTDLEIYFSLSEILNIDMYTRVAGDSDRQVLFNIPKKETNADVYVRLNSRNHLFEGCNGDREPTNTLYNKYIIAGSIFNLPVGEHTLESTIDCQGVAYLHRYY